MQTVFTILSVLVGGIITLVVTIIVEKSRTPKLSLHLAPPIDMNYQNRPARLARFLVIECRNAPLPRFLRWVSRSAASQCHGTITFHHLDGQNVFGYSMALRWSGSLEPTPLTIILGEQRGVLIDQERMSRESRVEIYPGENWKLDVAARFDNEDECYGWSNLSYFSTPVWRNPNFVLGRERYLVKITVMSASRQVSKIFRLVNDGPQTAFRLKNSLQTDRVFGDI